MTLKGMLMILGRLVRWSSFRQNPLLSRRAEAGPELFNPELNWAFKTSKGFDWVV